MRIAKRFVGCWRVIRGLGTTLVIAASLGSLPAAANGAEQARPAGSGGPIVEVVMKATNARRTFTYDQLKTLGFAEFSTSTPWTRDVATFKGVRLKEILAALDVRSGTIKAIALNDYAAELPVQDAFEHGVLLALTMNGKRLSVRDKGPLWILYPFDDNPSLKCEVVYSRSVWQLKRLEITP
jgi:hypothetical protein